MSKLDELVLEKCPNGVVFKQLHELGNFYGGLSGKSKEDFSNGNSKYVTYMNVFSNISVDTKVQDKVKIDSKEKQNQVKYGDVLFTGSSENPSECGISSVVTDLVSEELYLNSFCFGFRFFQSNLFDPEFLKYLFRSDSLRKQINKTASGVTRFNVSKKKMENVLIPIPPIGVQEEIVRILDNFTELTAELIAELTARKQQYEYYRNKLISSSTSQLVKLKDISNIYLGLTYTPNYVDNGIKFISAQNTSGDKLDFKNVKYISREEYLKSTSNAKPKRGDILFTRVGSNLGHPILLDTDEELCIFVSLGFLRIKESNVFNSYIKHWLNSDSFWTQLRKNVHGAAKVNLNTGWLKEFDVPIPSFEEQKYVADILDKFDKLVNDISEGIPAEIAARQKQYEYYRDKLLTFKEVGNESI